jgi:hypothetical protein
LAGLVGDAAPALAASLPFEGDVNAALILGFPLATGPLLDRRSTCFILADPGNLDAGLGALIWAAQGTEPALTESALAETVRLLKAARRFASFFRGQPLSSSTLSGRPTGRDETYSNVQTSYWKILDDDPNGRRPRQSDVAEDLTVSEDTVRRICHDQKKLTGQRAWPPPRPLESFC